MTHASVRDRLAALEIFGIKLGLSNISALCDALGHPERAFHVVHVAGTNGKGSVTAMVQAALQAAGIASARYTSPHLVDLAERFVIGAAPVDAATLESRGAVVLDTADALVHSGTLAAPPTFFEATTALAFELFRHAGVQVAVIEVGLGGRWDATNVVAPAVTAITSIGLDHQQQLGSTLSAIAGEKAGILKPGIPVVMGPLAPEAEAVVRRTAAERRAPVIGTYDGVALGVTHDDGRPVLRVRTPTHDYGTLTCNLRGDHQIDNAVTAIRTLECLADAGLAVPPEAIADGLRHVEWPGRLEQFTLEDGRSLLLDAAHNPDGAVVLARYLRRWHPERPPLVFAAMRDKAIPEILSALLPVVGPIILTAPDMPRAMPPSELAEAVAHLVRGRDVQVEASPIRAVQRALTLGSPVCVAGSIFLAGAVREACMAHAILK